MRAIGEYYVRDDERQITLPRPEKTGHLEWMLRYAPNSITREHQLVIACIVAAYRELVLSPQSSSVKKMADLKRHAQSLSIGDDDARL